MIAYELPPQNNAEQTPQTEMIEQKIQEGIDNENTIDLTLYFTETNAQISQVVEQEQDTTIQKLNEARSIRNSIMCLQEQAFLKIASSSLSTKQQKIDKNKIKILVSSLRVEEEIQAINERIENLENALNGGDQVEIADKIYWAESFLSWEEIKIPELKQLEKILKERIEN